jgi:glyoxylase-like metal-dependent hydrolase (beta-lactamase superfamily II)
MRLAEGYVDTSLIVHGLTPGVKRWISITSYLILGGPTPIVVDTGVDDGAGPTRRGDPWGTLTGVLAKHGLEVGDVGLVVCTHLHYDHTGMIDRFPNARIAVQRRELQYAAAPMYPTGFYDAAVIAKLVDPLRARVDLLDGDTQIATGIRTVLTGGHSPGHQMVYVDVPSGQAVICGDIAYLIDPSVTEGVPPGYTINMADNLAALARVKRDAVHVLPMHDPVVHERYPNGIV